MDEQNDISERISSWVSDKQRLEEGLGSLLKKWAKRAVAAAVDKVAGPIYALGKGLGQGRVSKRILNRAAGYMLTAMVDGIKKHARRVRYQVKGDDLYLVVEFTFPRRELHERILTEMKVWPLDPEKLDPAGEALDRALLNMSEEKYVRQTMLTAVRSVKRHSFWKFVARGMSEWIRGNPSKEPLTPEQVVKNAIPYDFEITKIHENRYDASLYIKIPIGTAERRSTGAGFTFVDA